MMISSTLTNHLIVGGSSRCGCMSNGYNRCFEISARNHNVMKGKQFFPREKVSSASTGRQIAFCVPKYPNKGIRLPKKTQWWEKDMKDNMRSIESLEDLEKQLLLAGEKLVAVHFFSPRCGACKALHPKVHQFAKMYPGLQFLLVNHDEQEEICNKLRVNVLPLFHLHKGAEGRVSTFSCTILTIHKFRNALKKHGFQTESLAAEKGLEDPKLESFDPPTDTPDGDGSQTKDEDGGPVAPSDD